MSDVLTDEQRLAVYDAGKGELGDYNAGLLAVERAVIAALAAMGGVDADAVAAEIVSCVDRQCNPDENYEACARLVRLALATAEARHAESLRMVHNCALALPPGDFRVEVCAWLDRALGLEG